MAGCSSRNGSGGILNLAARVEPQVPRAPRFAEAECHERTDSERPRSLGIDPHFTLKAHHKMTNMVFSSMLVTQFRHLVYQSLLFVYPHL